MLSDRATILSHTTLTALIIISTIILPITCKNATSISPTPRTSFETPRPSSATQQTSSSTSGSSSSTPTNTSKTVYSTYSCRIKPEDRQVVKYLQDSLVYIFEVSIYNESQDPLRTDVSETYKPWKWYRTNSEHGKTLLALSFNYDVLSLNILTIGVEHVYLKLKDSPQGCFKKLTAEQRVEILRAKVFDNFKRPKKIQTDENGVGIEDESSVMFVCNEIVRQNNGFGEFANRCCRRDANGEITCSEKEDNVYITVLYVCIGLVKLTMFMFCPLLIPAQMYTAAYLASEYVVNLTQELKLKIFVSESPTTSVRYKNRLTLNEISDWKRLRESLEDIPMDEICHVKVPELRIKVQGKRIIPANEPPTGLLRSLYDNLIRCKLRGIEPFKECCDMSVFGSLEPHIKYKCTWDQVVIQFMKFVTLMLTPLPFYIRVFVYYRFEEQELNARKKMLANFDLEQDFNPFRMNMIQYYSPTHPLFYTTYAFYIISGIIIGFSGKWIREKLKSITKSSFHDMQSVSRTNVLQIVIGILIWPFKKIGLIALVACPVYTIITLPFWCVIFLLYGIPTFYLGYRLVFHSIKQLGGDVGISIFESDKPMSNMKQKAYKVKKRIAKIDRGVHINRSIITDEDKHSPCLAGFGRLFACRRLFLQVTVSVFCLIVLFSSVLMFVEAIGIIVEVLVFTMMGIIVNAGSTLRYVSMALLVIVYMHNCYNSVYENYLEFNGTVLNDIMDRVEDLKKIASLPSSMQENAAFQVLVFTMMGIIVNAGSTLRYVSMALLVIVYMHNCYNSVYENYLEFNGTVLNDIMDRVEDLKKIASLPSSMQENAAFQVLVFTMMGIIVNAGSTLRYVSMALLVIVYMHNCYNSVYENYLEFNGTVLNDIMDRVEDLKKIASLPSSMQENAAFHAIGIIVEVLVFTMMGIIVNAGSTLRYVSMALLVIVYMHNCYNSVYENYLEFNGTVLNDIMDRVEERTEENRQLTFKYAGKRRVSEVVEVLVFTMMGIIVNAGSTLRYVSMALLVIVYMHNCYNSVYENYLEFNGTVLNDIMDRVEDLKKIASLPSSMQENAAFQVKCVEAVDEIQTTLNLEKEMPQWRIGHLLLFLDSFDTPRIPLNLFKKLCEVRIHGAPGPVYINLLKATAKFSVIVVFLFFVMIVVMAFGSNQQMSSTNQTLATLAGGFVPMLLKNVLSSKSTKLNLKTLSFKGQVDEIIAEYKQNWPINDFTLTKYDPIAEAEAEAEKEKEKENEGKDAKEGKVKDENESGEKDKTDKETVNEKQATEDTEKEKETIKVNGGPSNGIGTTSNSLQPPALFRDSLEDLAIETLGKSPRWLSRLSIMPTEDNFVDLFIDLSATAEEPAWTWYDDEADSLQSITMLNNYEMQSRDPRMPYYQPTVIQIDGNDAMDGYPLTSPPDYNSVVMKRQ